MTVALLSLELYLPMSRSLKDKRVVLRRLKDRMGAMNVAVARWRTRTSGSAPASAW
jgi:uncharacterized protein YlxP (DUF503 family)